MKNKCGVIVVDNMGIIPSLLFSLEWVQFSRKISIEMCHQVFVLFEPGEDRSAHFLAEVCQK